MQNMHNFFINTYKGVYCGVCSGKNSKFFDFSKKSAILSKKFCRDIIQHTIQPMIYFHSHIPKVTELFNLFQKCSLKGDFEENKEIKEVSL